MSLVYRVDVRFELADRSSALPLGTGGGARSSCVDFLEGGIGTSSSSFSTLPPVNCDSDGTGVWSASGLWTRFMPGTGIIGMRGAGCDGDVGACSASSLVFLSFVERFFGGAPPGIGIPPGGPNMPAIPMPPLILAIRSLSSSRRLDSSSMLSSSSSPSSTVSSSSPTSGSFLGAVLARRGGAGASVSSLSPAPTVPASSSVVSPAAEWSASLPSLTSSCSGAAGTGDIGSGGRRCADGTRGFSLETSKDCLSVSALRSRCISSPSPSSSCSDGSDGFLGGAFFFSLPPPSARLCACSICCC